MSASKYIFQVLAVGLIVFASCTKATEEKVAHKWYLQSDDAEFDFQPDGKLVITDKKADKVHKGKWILHRKELILEMKIANGTGDSSSRKDNIRKLTEEEMVLHSKFEGEQEFKRVE